MAVRIQRLFVRSGMLLIKPWYAQEALEMRLHYFADGSMRSWWLS